MLYLIGLGWADKPLEAARSHISAKSPRLLKFSQALEDNAYTLSVTLSTYAGKTMSRYTDQGDPVVEIDLRSDRRGISQLFLRTQGNHEGAVVLNVSGDKVSCPWQDSSAGGITYSDFGPFSEIHVGRSAHQVGLASEESRLGKRFEEVYVVAAGTVRFLGVRRSRSSAGRTLTNELVIESPDAETRPNIHRRHLRKHMRNG